jgi:hypothetical protein
MDDANVASPGLLPLQLARRRALRPHPRLLLERAQPLVLPRTAEEVCRGPSATTRFECRRSCTRSQAPTCRHSITMLKGAAANPRFMQKAASRTSAPLYPRLVAWANTLFGEPRLIAATSELSVPSRDAPQRAGASDPPLPAPPSTPGVTLQRPDPHNQGDVHDAPCEPALNPNRLRVLASLPITRRQACQPRPHAAELPSPLVLPAHMPPRLELVKSGDESGPGPHQLVKFRRFPASSPRI